MICKWCGETIKAGTRTCRRCKRELPALSDCGGFYDLVVKDAPTPVCAPAPQSAAQSPVQPVIPQRSRNNPLISLLLVVAVAMAVISLILTLSLSGKLADAREEAQKLRSQLEFREEEPSADPTVDTSGEEDPEIPADPSQIRIVLEDGLGNVSLTDAQNALLTSGALHISLCQSEEAEPMLTCTLQIRSDEEDEDMLSLQITDAGPWTIHSIEWRVSGQIELPMDAIESFLPSASVNTPDAVTESAKAIKDLSGGSVSCRLTGVDEHGKELTITIDGIVIE